MAKSLNRIRFACGNCMTRMEIRQRFAGRQVRCPFCHTMLTVPVESRPEKFAEEYGVSEGSRDAGDGDLKVSEIAVTCTICQTRMYASPSQVGQTLTCPDCETPNVVQLPKPKPPKPPADPAVQEEYTIYGEDQPPVTVKAVHQKYLPVVCSLCHTRLLATEDQIGQTITCPDCRTDNVVRAVPEKAAPQYPTAAERGEYSVSERDPSQSSIAKRNEELFVVKCPVCKTRLHARVDQSGKRMKCPDCRRSFEIPKPHVKVRPIAEEDELVDFGGYDVGAPVDRTALFGAESAPPQELPAERRSKPGDSEESPNVDETLVERQRVPLPAWPLVAGVFTYPFQPGVVKHWLIFSIAGGAFIWSALAAIALSNLGGLMLIPGMIFFGCLALVALAGLIGLCLLLLAIAGDTASGCEGLESWPISDPFDRMFDAFYVFNSLAMSGGAIGLTVDRFLIEAGVPQGVGTALGVWLGFPVFLLCFLETASSINPFSGSIWRSLFTAWPGWIGFYVLSAILGAVVVAFDVFVAPILGFLGNLAATVLVLAALMIYFRMLGRLAWYSAVRDAEVMKRRKRSTNAE